MVSPEFFLVIQGLYNSGIKYFLLKRNLLKKKITFNLPKIPQALPNLQQLKLNSMNASISSGKLTPISAQQISQINFETLNVIGVIDPSELLTPMVSAEIDLTDKGPVLNVRMVILIPKTLLGKAPVELFLDLDNAAQNELRLVLNYESAEKTPKDYLAWFVSYAHDIKDGEQEIKSIRTFTQNTHFEDANPKTSRGTVTHVLQS